MLFVDLIELSWNTLDSGFVTGAPIRSMHRRPGCYVLRHQHSGKFYVGSATDIYSRVAQHRNSLSDSNTVSQEVLAICRQEAGFFFDVAFILTTDREEAFDYEQAYLDKYFDTGVLLNRSRYARSKGSIATLETRQLQRKAQLGTRRSPEIKAKIGAAQKGKPKSEKHRLAFQKASELRSVAVLIDGTQYPSYVEAANKLGVKRSTVQQRVRSNSARFKNWKLN